MNEILDEEKNQLKITHQMHTKNNKQNLNLISDFGLSSFEIPRKYKRKAFLLKSIPFPLKENAKDKL